MRQQVEWDNILFAWQYLVSEKAEIRTLGESRKQGRYNNALVFKANEQQHNHIISLTSSKGAGKAF